MGELTPFPPPEEGPILVVSPGPRWPYAARAAGWRVCRRDLAPQPWCQAGTLAVAGPAWSAGDVVLALSRGAGVVLDPVDPSDPAMGSRLASVLDDARRLHARQWPPAPSGTPAPFGIDGSTAELLDDLARGRQVRAAARQANMSLRTAHRRLRDARAALGAATTAEAVGRWARRRPVPAEAGRDGDA